MALDADGDWETIARGVSPLSGEYIVEEQDADTDEGNHHQSAIYRRLIFLQNQNFIQTEVRLVSKLSGGKDKKSKQNKKSGKKDKGKGLAKGGREGENDSEEWELDYTYLDDHHRALLTALVLNPDLLQRGRKVVHPTHNNKTNSNSSSSGSGPSPGPSALLVGLGGGALPMCLQVQSLFFQTKIQRSFHSHHPYRTFNCLTTPSHLIIILILSPSHPLIHSLSPHHNTAISPCIASVGV